MRYSIQIESELSAGMLNGKLMSCLKPTTSYECHCARLARLTSLLSSDRHDVVVFHDSCPALRLTVANGKETRRIDCVIVPSKKDREQDLRYEGRNRKNMRFGFAAGDLSQWILKGATDVPEAKKARVIRVKKREFVPKTVKRS